VQTNPVANDLDRLARTARRVLADGEQMTLLINGVGRLCPGNPMVTLHDRNGQPTFLCEPGSPVAAAARRGCAAVLTIDVREPGGTVVSLILGGLLEVIGVDLIDDVPVDLVALPPEQVMVEYDEPDCTAISQFTVPSELYLRVEPGLRPADIAPIVEHTNTGHQAELREWVRRHHDRPEYTVAGAELVSLDERGASIHWVDSTGGHITTITFARPASTITEMVVLLRGELTA
jgi:Protein of unknown function (DUF2470)